MNTIRFFQHKSILVAILVFCAIISLFVAVSVSLADNPIIQTIYTADPSPLVHNGRVYLYTGHDEDGSTYFTMNEWRVWSSADMVNWTDHGSPLRYSTFSWAAGDAWAGQAIYRNGKFYWYVPVKHTNGAPAIGVAVSNSPTGPFTDARGTPLLGPTWGYIDPTVFIDDDGQAYLYWGNPGLWYVRLNADMISYSGSVTQIPLTTAGFGARSGNPDRPTLYEEGPWVYKRNGTYYMVFAADCCSNGEYIAYSTSSSPTGPWTYRGVIMPKQGSSFTNHAGITDFNGSSYFFYHNGALPGGGGFTRSVAVEKFTYNTNGTFPTINMSTSGAPQAGTLNPYITNEAETMAWASGVETEPSSEGGMNVGFVDNGDYIKVKGVNFGSGAASFEARVASATSGGNIELRLDSSTGTLVGTCSVQATGGWQTWVTRTCTVSGATGTHDLYLKFTGGSSTPPAARRLPPHAPQLKSLGRPTLQRRSLRRQRGLRPQVARRTPPHAQLLPAAYPQIPPPTLPAAARLAARSHPPSAHPLPTMARGSSAGNRPTWEPTSTRGTPTASRSTASTSPIYTLPPARTRPRSAAIGM